MYELWVFLHLVGAFGFFMAHGTSAVTAFRLRRERDPARVAALLDLSAASLGMLYGSLLLLLTGGVVAGFVGHWWGAAWIWTALGLLVLLMVAMYLLASPYYNQVRNAVGVPTYAQLKKEEDPGPPASPQELDRLLASPRPFVVAGTGGIGLLAILWLMVFKPF